MSSVIIELIDKSSLATYDKYGLEQLEYAIYEFLKNENPKGFTNDYKAREYINHIGVTDFTKVILKHVIEVAALMRELNEPTNPSSVENILYNKLQKSINDAALALLDDDILRLLIRSFVYHRYVIDAKEVLDTLYLDDAFETNLIKKIDMYFE